MSSQGINDLVSQIEAARRAKEYSKMHEFADKALDQLVDQAEFGAWKLRAKISYELSMAAFAQEQYRLALDFATQSSDESRNADDLAGEVSAEMTIGGNILPALGKWPLGADTLQGALTLAQEKPAPLLPEDKKRLARGVLNCYLHLINLTIDHHGDPQEVSGYIDAVKTNSVFVAEYANTDYGRGYVKKATDYIASQK